MGRDKNKPHNPSTHEGTDRNPADASTKPGGKSGRDPGRSTTTSRDAVLRDGSTQGPPGTAATGNAGARADNPAKRSEQDRV